MKSITGNYHAEAGEREFQNRGNCSCGANDWEEIQFCWKKERLCPLERCEMQEGPDFCDWFAYGFKCKKCGEIREEE